MDHADHLTWPALREQVRAGSPVYLPVGALEQHGPHLPLGTDSLIAERLAERVAEELGGSVLPTLPYGAPSRPRSGGGDLFPVPALPLPVLVAVLEGIAGGVRALGCRLLVVVSWHWENASVLWDAVHTVFKDGDARALIFDSPGDSLSDGVIGELFPEGFPGWANEHAGRLETALMEHLSPALVGARPRVDYQGTWYDVLPTPESAVPAHGVFYDPGDVDADLGRRCFDEMTAALADAVRSHVEEGRSPSS